MNTAAPWHLTGRGFILMYRFQHSFIRESCFLPEEWMLKKWSGMGYVMLVDYLESPVGPYKELLVIPGKSNFGGSRHGTITKIYVDSEESMNSGRSNWGIPKELTEFSWTREGKQHEIRIGGDQAWMEIVLEPGTVPFPVDTRLLPLHLYQELDGKVFKVTPLGKGTGHFTLIKGIDVNPDFFPDLDLVEPMVAIYVDPFRLTFPVPEIKPFIGNK